MNNLFYRCFFFFSKKRSRQPSRPSEAPQLHFPNFNDCKEVVEGRPRSAALSCHQGSSAMARDGGTNPQSATTLSTLPRWAGTEPEPGSA